MTRKKETTTTTMMIIIQSNPTKKKKKANEEKRKGKGLGIDINAIQDERDFGIEFEMAMDDIGDVQGLDMGEL